MSRVAQRRRGRAGRVRLRCRSTVERPELGTRAESGEPGLHGGDSRSSLRLFDKFLDDNASATAVAPDVDHQVLAFTWATNDFRGQFTFSVGGHRDGTRRFRLRPGTTQALEVFDGSAWQPLGALTTAIPNNTWTPFAVDATATLRIGTQEFTTTIRAEAADTLSGTTFTTGDPIEYGMTFFVDDLSITSG
jgi:hypothetical protein